MEPYRCPCWNCAGTTFHPDQLIHRRLNLFLSRLNERQRKWVAGWQVLKMEGSKMEAQVGSITGIKLHLIEQGCRQLNELKKMDCWQHQCQCAACKAELRSPNRRIHGRLNILLGHLNEQQRRWLVAIESLRIGRGGDRNMSVITGMNVETIRRGRRELQADLVDYPPGRIRRPGAGRPSSKTMG